MTEITWPISVTAQVVRPPPLPEGTIPWECMSCGHLRYESRYQRATAARSPGTCVCGSDMWRSPPEGDPFTIRGSISFTAT